jgi:hypothetical protein
MAKKRDHRNDMNKPLPKVNVKFAAAGSSGNMTPEMFRSMVCNPIYTGMGPFPALIDDETWVHAATRAVEEDGAEQFLVNMLYVLRQSLGTGMPESGDE